MNIFQKVRMKVMTIATAVTLSGTGFAYEGAIDTSPEVLNLDIFSYEDFAKQDPNTIQLLRKALLEKGIVGIRGVPGYKESAKRYIEKAREFSSLPLRVKQSYSPNRSAGEFLGYEIGKEKFLRPNGSWMVDDSKASYYAFVPNSLENKWPIECDLQTPFQEIAYLMFDIGRRVMESIDLIGPRTVIASNEITGVGRMLHYDKQSDETMENPFWCGAHFDHGLFTVLLPAFYFLDGKAIPEPPEAGLFVRTKAGTQFHKVVSDDPDVMLFQVGEFGQLASNDAIKATKHRVHKARGGIERYTMALFINAAMDTVIRSHSELTKDARYGAGAGESCRFKHWHEASLNRYLFKDEEDQ
ncbi:MAG: isopenicillin N synthase family oxygenase [Chlamydiae bacterium]|nr:isopenicillin N synthase family oxygenase [Chlamydiota bacterium]